MATIIGTYQDYELAGREPHDRRCVDTTQLLKLKRTSNPTLLHRALLGNAVRVPRHFHVSREPGRVEVAPRKGDNAVNEKETKYPGIIEWDGRRLLNDQGRSCRWHTRKYPTSSCELIAT